VIGAQRSLPQLLDDANAGVQRLSLTTRGWSTFMPNVAAVDEVLNSLEGLRRTVLELRPHSASLKAK
jgi:hypothetical protein